jgi:hypothetical protein
MPSSEQPGASSDNLGYDATPGALDSPTVAAARMLGGVIAQCRGTAEHRTRAEVDLRAVQDIQRKLQADPEDPSARQWVRQLATAWSFRARDNTRSIRKILDLLDGSHR